MCGIAGFLDRSPTMTALDLDATVTRMADSLYHRGPDDGGTWVDAEAGVALGNRRLAILDLSDQGHQPMSSANGRYVVTFNGELYNFRDLRHQLEALGHVFRGHSDTEVLLAAVSEWGLEAALSRFNGMFGFALWDRHRRLLHLVRDRMGEKPVYYGQMGTSILFGSELKALRAHPQFRGEVDRRALSLYFRYNCIPAPWSIYRGVQKLLPGTVLTLSADGSSEPTPVAYWSLHQAVEQGLSDPFTGDVSAAVEELDSLLRDAVKLRMEADVPLGAFLSGGIDSSTVVALMQAQADRPVRTFTIGTHDARFNEAEDARAVARHLGTDHTQLYVTPEQAIAVIPRLPALYDEPFSDSSQIPTFLVSELARQDVTVSLSGDGGDELFGGYNRHVWGQSVWRTVDRIPRKLRHALAGMLTAASPDSWDSVSLKLKPVLRGRANARLWGNKVYKLADTLRSEGPQAMYMSLTSHWKDPAALVLGAQEPTPRAMEDGSWIIAPNLTQMMMYLDAISYLPDDILTKVDRATMGVSLEGRIPFLDHRVVEFSWRVPPSMKIRDGQGKWLLRQLLYRYVPREMVERPKTGFGVPIGTWLRGPLKDWAESLLDEGRLCQEGFLDIPLIRQKWISHQSGARSFEYELWDVLMFQSWLDYQREPIDIET